jgi:hypothetical protein
MASPQDHPSQLILAQFAASGETLAVKVSLCGLSRWLRQIELRV